MLHLDVETAELSEALDNGSLLAKLDYAKFLFNQLGDILSAQNKCNEIITEAMTRPFEETDDDFGSEMYIEAAKRILGVIEDSQRSSQPPM